MNWVKLGQALALRFDVLPADLCRELLDIENDIKPFGYAEVKRIIQQELDRSPEELFASFDETPFAVTSSGQLHSAVAPSGVRLVVKVQSDATEKEFRVQSAVMRGVAACFDAVKAFETEAFSRAVADFREQRASELALSVAATNARKMTVLAEGDPSEQNIRVRSEYSGRRALCWEFIDGVPVGNIINSIRTARQGEAVDRLPQQYNLEQIARQIYRNALNQIFRDGVFHADVSPAGLLILPTGSIAYVDFAVVGRLDDERKRSLQAHYACLLQGHVDEAVDKLIECADLPSWSEYADLRRSLANILEDRLDGFQSPVGSVPRDASQNTYASLMSTFRDYQLTLPSDLSAYFRTMLTIESLVFELYPDFDTVGEQSRFHSLAARQDYRQALELSQAVEDAARLYQDAVELVSDLRRLHGTARTIEVSLQTLRIRLLQYGFWAVLVAAGTYFAIRSDALREAIALRPIVLGGMLLAIVLFLLNRFWRQGRQLSRVDRAIVSTREVSSRSLGRVR